MLPRTIEPANRSMQLGARNNGLPRIPHNPVQGSTESLTPDASLSTAAL